MTTESWHLKGEYFENCNCEVLCPCVVPGPPTDPTEGHCDVGFAFHIQEGNFAGVSLNDLNFVVIAYTPGNMGAGNWTTAVYIDEKANEEQRQALGRILSGDLGGPAERWMPLTSDFKGTTYCPITYTAQGRTRSVSPTRTCSRGMSSSTPSLCTMRAVFGANCRSARKAELVSHRARNSSTWPRRTSVVMMAADSK